MPVLAQFQVLRTGPRAESLRLACGLLCLLMVAVARAAEPMATLTLLQGEATVVVGARAYVAVTGARLGAGAIVQTDAKTALLRLEWSDGSLVDLGPATQIMIRPGATLPRTALFYVLQGWVKHSQPSALAGQIGAAFDVAPFKGVLVNHVDGDVTTLFSESGGEQLTGRRGGVALALRAGQAAVDEPGSAPRTQPRPPSGWLQRIPRSFRDTIPSRLSDFKAAPAALRARAAWGYAELEPWLKAEQGVRRDFPTRFDDMLDQAGFRDSVAKNLSQHPEWDSALRHHRAAASPRKSRPTNDQEPSR